MPALVFLESSDIGAGYCAEAARALGYEPLFLCDLASYQADSLARILAAPHRQLDTSKRELVEEALRALPDRDRAALVTLVDSRLVVASEVARALGLRGLDPAVVRLKSKTHVAALVPEASPRTIGFRRDAVPRAVLAALLAESGTLIVKPDAGAGAAGIFVVSSIAELDAIDASLARSAASPHASGDFLAQVFVQGALVSLEGFVAAGAVHVLGFTDRQKIGATECRAAFPVDDTLPAAARAGCEAAVRTLLSRAGFANGYFHVEFMLEGERAWLIDANVGRLGGGPVGELLALAYDVPPSAIYQHFLEVTLFRDRAAVSPYRRTDRRRASSVLYGLKDGGTLVGVELPEGSATRHTQILGEGARVTPMGTDDWSWVGILTGLDDDLQRACRALRIRTQHGLETPCF